jgi:hypothetical protein
MTTVQSGPICNLNVLNGKLINTEINADNFNLTDGIFKIKLKSKAGLTENYDFEFPDSKGNPNDTLVNLGNGSTAWNDSLQTLFDGQSNQLLGTADDVEFKSIKLTTGTNSSTLKSHPNVITDYDIIFPDEQGVASTILHNDGAGQLSWVSYDVSVGSGGDVTFSSVIVTGDLEVLGTTTTLSTVNLDIKDKIITLNDGETIAGVSGNFAGIEIDRGTLTNYQFRFNDTDTLEPVFEIGDVGGTFFEVALKENLSVAGTIPVWSVNGRLDSTNGLSSDIIDQLNNIYVPTLASISNAEWIFLSTMDQSVGTTDNVTFANILTSGTVDGIDISLLNTNFNNHEADVANPHSVTASQVSLGITNDVEFKTVSITSSVGTLILNTNASGTNYGLTFPSAQGLNGDVLINDGTGILTWETAADIDSITDVGGTTRVETQQITNNITFTTNNVEQMKIDIDGNVTINDTLRMISSVSGFIDIIPPSTVTEAGSNYKLTLPPNVGSIGKTLTLSDNSGTLIWSTVSLNSIQDADDDTKIELDRLPDDDIIYFVNKDNDTLILSKDSVIFNITDNVIPQLSMTSNIDIFSTIAFNYNTNTTITPVAVFGIEYGFVFTPSISGTLDKISILVGTRNDLSTYTFRIRNGSGLGGSILYQDATIILSNSGTHTNFNIITSVFLLSGSSYTVTYELNVAGVGSTFAANNTVTPVSFNTGNIYAVYFVEVFQHNGKETDIYGKLTLNNDSFGTGKIGINLNSSTVDYEITLPAVQGSSLTALVNDGTGILTWENFSPYDQTLNTTDDVEFNSVKLTTSPSTNSTTLKSHSTVSSNYDILFPNAQAPGGTNSILTNVGGTGQLWWFEFNQTVNTTDNVEFNNIQNGNGLVTLPSYGFSSDVQTGMYNAGSGELGFTSSSINNEIARIRDGSISFRSISGGSIANAPTGQHALYLDSSNNNVLHKIDSSGNKEMIGMGIRIVTSSGTPLVIAIDRSYKFIRCTGDDDITLNLPDVLTSSGMELFIVHRITTGGKIVTVEPNGTELIDDNSNIILPVLGSKMYIICDGERWHTF